MIVERCNNLEYLKFHDGQRKLLRTMSKGRKSSFMETAVQGSSAGTKGRSGRRKSMLRDVQEDKQIANDHALSFSKSFFLRLVIAINVTTACLYSVTIVRISLDAYGPPDNCSPTDFSYNSCLCSIVMR